MAYPSSVISSVLQSLRQKARHRVWVISDLQQSMPAEARRCMTSAVEDFRSLNLPIDQIWYLGDAVEEANLPHLQEMAAMQIEMLGAFGVPLKYVLGNHDFDYLRKCGGAQPAAIFRDAVARTQGWRTTDSIESFYFFDQIGDFTVVFFSDHADSAGRWVSTHGLVHGQVSAYPYDTAAYQAVRDRIAGIDGPVITCSHYAFSGGNRPSALHDLMLPLPPNIRLHLYAHAHIGDGAWAGKDLYRKISAVDNHPIIQCDIASLEDARGSATRSAVLEIYEDQSLGLFFRNHSCRNWEESLLLDGQRKLA